MKDNLIISQAKQLIDLAGTSKHKDITILANISSLIFYNFEIFQIFFLT